MWHEEKAALADDHRSKLQVAAMLEAERPDAAADYERIVGPAAADAPPMSFSDFEHAVNDAFAKVFRLVERTPDGARQQLELSRARAEWDSYE
jgi:hypothetical protein